MSSKKNSAASTGVRERQKKLGPAPFASFEDMSDDLSSPESKGYQPMPEISEEQYRMEREASNRYANSSSTTSAAQTPTTPRIDVEQASSSPSTPERELFGGVDEGTGVSSAFLEGAADVDLRSSAEEMMPVSAARKQQSLMSKERAAAASAAAAAANSGSATPSLLARSANAAVAARRKISWDAAAAGEQYNYGHSQLERKGSASRNVDPFFFPSSVHDTRLSSISSNMSATSGMSALSSFSTSRRSPSPHRMQLETSFCGPKANAGPLGTESSDDVEDQELVELCRKGRHNSGRGSSLMPNPLDYWPATTPSASPVPGSYLSASMVKYATEPRSRPSSPMNWTSRTASPTPLMQNQSQTMANEGSTSSSSRWLASPRNMERRSSSPHRTLVETSFCGRKQLKVPDAEEEVAPRGPSPAPSSLGGSLLNIQAHPFKYSTEPRSRPVSPSASRTFLTPLPPSGHGSDSRRGSSHSLRCSSPMIETSFCGAKQLLQRLDTLEKSSPPTSRAAVAHQQQPREKDMVSSGSQSSLRPVRYATEPRSRPSSPAPMGLMVDSPKLGRRPSSPHRTVVETSFCGAKKQQSHNNGRQDSVTSDGSQQQQSLQPTEAAAPLPPSINGSQNSIHPLPVRYATEPRSRPVSPAPPTAEFGSSRSMRSPSPHRMLVETSFCGARRERNNELEDPAIVGSPRPQRKASATSLSAAVAAAVGVKYSTEPRSRPVSPSPNFLMASAAAAAGSNHSTPDATRRVTRSPSPHHTIVETSFVGTWKKPVDEDLHQVRNKQQQQQPKEEQPVISDDETSSTSSPSSPSDIEDDSSIDEPSISEIPVNRNIVIVHQPTVEEEQQQQHQKDATVVEFATDWASDAGFNATWPTTTDQEEMTTFAPQGVDSDDDNASTSIGSPSPPSQKSNNGRFGNNAPIESNPVPYTSATASPSMASRQPHPSSGRNMPKPVACPKPPQSFTSYQASDSSAQNSPVGSPALPFRHRRSIELGSGAASETASPSPSSPFPSRKTSLAFGGFLQRRESGAPVTEEQTTTLPSQLDHTLTSSSTVASATVGLPKSERKDSKKEGKKGGVLSALFGRRSIKNKAAGLTLPVQSRDPSPARSGTGPDSGDDLDDDAVDQGFKHQMLTSETATDEREAKKPAGKVDPPADPPEPPKEEVSFIFHQDSIEEELPYVPTTLPIERPVAPFITPVRARIMSEVKTTPTERPRCSVTFAPRSNITDYVKIADPETTAAVVQAVVPPAVQKIRIYLPRLSEREESQEEEEEEAKAAAMPSAATAAPVPAVSIKVSSVGSVKWEHFSEQVFRQSKRFQEQMTAAPASIGVAITETAVAPAPLPAIKNWINVEELPEPIKEPKAIRLVVTTGNKAKQPQQQLQQAAMQKQQQQQQPVDPEMKLSVSNRKDSVCSETALLREIDEPEAEEDRSPPLDVDCDDDDDDDDEEKQPLQAADDSSGNASSVGNADDDSDDGNETTVLLVQHSTSTSGAAGNNLAVVGSAPFGMDLDIHSNRSSIAAAGDIPSPDDDISLQQ